MPVYRNLKVRYRTPFAGRGGHMPEKNVGSHNVGQKIQRDGTTQKQTRDAVLKAVAEADKITKGNGNGSGSHAAGK